MKRDLTKWLLIVAVLALYCVLSQVTYGQEAEPNAVPGFTAWALGGDGVQEIRLGYEGLLPDVEVAFGALHYDAAEPDREEWPMRGYVIAHALDAQMLATALGGERPLPDGNLYAGLFGEYVKDRSDEWSGGYVLGGLVDWPRGWQTVVEYQACLWNTDDSEYEIMFGLRRRF